MKLLAQAEIDAATIKSRTVCGSCYACRGFYQMPNVKHAQAERTAWMERAIDDGSFVERMAAEINASGAEYFRAYDSGDLRDARDCYARRDVARLCPNTFFWIPTKLWAGADTETMTALLALAAEPGVSLRPSALLIDGPAPEIPGLHAGTRVVTSGATCPAPKQDGACLACRACWAREGVVAYAKH